MASKACEYHSASLFELQIPGLGSATFAKVSGLKMGVEEEKQREGGELIEKKYPGIANSENITAVRGVTKDQGLVDWFKQTADLAAGTGAAPCDDFKKTIVLIQKNRQQKEIRRYTIYEAWVKSIAHGDWDNTSTEKVMETIEIVNDYYVITDS